MYDLALLSLRLLDASSIEGVFKARYGLERSLFRPGEASFLHSDDHSLLEYESEEYVDLCDEKREGEAQRQTGT